MPDPKFKDGQPVPDEEVVHDPHVDKQYGPGSQARMAVLRNKLQDTLKSDHKKHSEQE